MNIPLTITITPCFERYSEVGYNYIIIDDCWLDHTRGKVTVFIYSTAGWTTPGAR